MSDINTNEEEGKKNLNFIEAAVEKDLAEGKNGGRVQTRFPPEPNGYLHIGHAKAICLDFGIAERHGGICNLRFDDTNPTKEDEEYVEAIKEDIQWLGYQWGNIYYASDYFQQLWDFAIRLIEEGKAYIDEQTSEQIAQQKGTPTQPGIESPYRNRPIEESLALFKKMNTGEIAEGAMVLRAKIDMALDKDENGKVVAIHAEADLETRNGNPADGRKVRGTIHWVSCAHCLDAEVELYDKLFTESNMNSIPDDADFKDYLNPNSVKVLQGAKLEESLKDAKPGDRFQFARNGYFTPDSKHEGVYNRIVTLKDSFKL